MFLETHTTEPTSVTFIVEIEPRSEDSRTRFWIYSVQLEKMAAKQGAP